jgi:hypothetical protein
MFFKGLKKYIEPHSKLSEYFRFFVLSFLPEFKNEFIKDEELEFELIKKLPKCDVYISIKLERHFSLQGEKGYIGTPKFFVHCIITGPFKKEFFNYDVTVDEFNKNVFFGLLNDNSIFKEYFILNNIIESWVVVTDQYFLSSFDTYKNRSKYQTLITPSQHEFVKDEFNLYPGIITYKDVKEGYTKRYDFCLFISYKYKFEAIYNSYDDWYFINYKSIKIIGKNKEISRNIEINRIIDINDDDRVDVFNSTELNKEGLFWDIYNNDVESIIVEHNIKGYKEFVFDKNTVEKINYAWSIYQKLMDATGHYKLFTPLD